MISFAISFLLAALLTPLVIALARRNGWVAPLREDRWHSRSTPLMGGIAIFLATVAAWLAVEPSAVSSVALPAVGIFLIGLVDDRVGLRPHAKLIGQLTAGAALIAGGTRFEALPPILALPLTLIWVVGITNALNLLDNMDGLAAGVCAISALALAAYCTGEGASSAAPAVLALAGGCAGFLLYNFNPARIFMGDCGSMFIGFSLAALAVQGTHRSAPNLGFSLLVPVAVLAIPIFDTTLVSVARMLHGRSLSRGGRDHSSHRLVALGLSERGTVLVLYALTALFGALALTATRLPMLTVGLLAALLFAGLTGLGLYLGFLQVYPEAAQVPSRLRLLSGRLLYKKQILQVFLDTVLIPVAFVVAHLLRFEGELPPDIASGVLTALPLVLAAKLAALALCRAYRGVWRYAGMADALRACVASWVGTVIAGCLLGGLNGFQGVSRAALVIDWLLFTLLVVAARMGYVLFRQLFEMLPLRSGPQVVILGAGDEALASVHRLRDPLSPRRAEVLGILDDTPGNQNRTLDGVPVLGPLSMLPALVNAKAPPACLLGVPARSEMGERILAFCRDQGITVHGEPEALLIASEERSKERAVGAAYA